MLLILPLFTALAACPGDKKVARRDTAMTQAAAIDTAQPEPGDLSDVKSNIPAATPDTFREHKELSPDVKRAMAEAARRNAASSGGGGGNYTDAPAPLMQAVEREQSVSRFCYQEFGQKSDPSLAGNVAMVVTVGSGGITDAKVGNSSWSSRGAGSAVNRCLNEKVRQAWKLSPGEVRPGRYVVQLSFRGS
jgi:hypothetical protein